MKILILGVGLVGSALATQLRAAGHTVVGTTTTPGKVDALSAICDEVHVLKGSDRDAVAAAASGCEVVVVTAGPNAQRSMTPEERAETYRTILVDTATAVSAAVSPGTQVIALSSLSVYGTAADHLATVTEQAPTTDSTDPSPANFLRMERTYLEALGEHACIFRCADIFGGEDPPIEAKVEMAHKYMGGSVPFRADALFYRVAVDDVLGAITHAIDQNLTGVFNLTHAEVPSTNADVFDTISEKLGKPAFVYRGEIQAPSAPISVQRLADTGFTTAHTAAAHA
ncbi:MAG: nucleoside-diphosphate-sugar epimerase [Glaciecola sp.]|jgi:nucleoside-diphosphate-sugar epimerase